MNTCARPDCRKPFTPRGGWAGQQIYCSTRCCHYCAAMAYTARNRQKSRDDSKLYYREHRDRHTTTVKRYRHEHPEVGREASRKLKHKRRVEIQHQRVWVSTLTTDEWLALLDAHEHRCFYCKRELKRLTQDHVTPLSRGGEHTMDNIVPACRPCNSSKGARTLYEFIVYRSGAVMHYISQTKECPTDTPYARLLLQVKELTC